MARKRRSCTMGWAIEARAVSCAAVAVEDGRVLGCATVPLPNPSTVRIPGRKAPLESGSFLRHPSEFFPVLKTAAAKALRQARLTAAEVESVGVAHEASWLVATRKDGSPLAATAVGKTLPQAWTLPPRHRPPAEQAHRMTLLARRSEEMFLASVADSLSPCGYWPRVWQVVEEQPDLAEKAELFLELGDYLTWAMTGEAVCGHQAARSRLGAPLPPPEGLDTRFLARCHPALGEVAARHRRFAPPMVSPWQPAGRLGRSAALKLGLRTGTRVAAPSLTTLAALPGAGIDAPGHLLIRFDDPITHTLFLRHPQTVPGLVGLAENAAYSGTWSFEAVQLGARAMFDWFATRQGRDEPKRGGHGGDGHGGGKKKGSGTNDLTRRAERLRPGETGLVALDWWEGSESPLHDRRLTGALVGLRPDTAPEAIYRALVEAAAFGAYTVLRGFERHGVFVRRVVVAGSLLDSMPLLGPLAADILGRELLVSSGPSPAAVGAALYARGALESEPAAAAEALLAATRAAAPPRKTAFKPREGHHSLYERLYDQYLALHEFLGKRSPRLMHELAALRDKAAAP